jgi:hypothetical protein
METLACTRRRLKVVWPVEMRLSGPGVDANSLSKGKTTRACEST